METSKKDFIQFLKKMILLIVISCLTTMLLFYLLVKDSKFQSSYQSVMQRKYDLLLKTNDKKIVIVGGSSAAFGINSKYLEEQTGLKVVNLGLHAGFGNLFTTEMMKQNINKDDIVLLAYEYTLASDCFDKLGDLNLIQSGIDSRLDMYKIIPVKNCVEIIGNFKNYAEYKFQNNTLSQGTYSSSSFDKDGNMILDRKEYTIKDYKNNIETYGQITENMLSISERNVEYLIKLKNELETRGVNVYIIAPPILSDAVNCDYSLLLSYYNTIQQKTGIPCISNPIDYIFDKHYMFDTIYHCNNLGEIKRTKLLVEDLKKIKVKWET